MSSNLFKAAKALADAVREQKEYVRIFEDCPKDSVEVALEQFDKEWAKESLNHTFKKE
jgi:hypothetical protein